MMPYHQTIGRCLKTNSLFCFACIFVFTDSRLLELDAQTRDLETTREFCQKDIQLNRILLWPLRFRTSRPFVTVSIINAQTFIHVLLGEWSLLIFHARREKNDKGVLFFAILHCVLHAWKTVKNFAQSRLNFFGFSMWVALWDFSCII